jgi:vancomycin resistance protein YoaR
LTALTAILTRPIRRLGPVSAAALVLALLLTAAGAVVFARAMTLRDAVLPGVRVAGVELGGLSREDARARLARELGPRLAVPLTVEVANRTFTVRPDRLWTLDVAATEERAFEAGRESLASRLGAVAAPFVYEQDVEPVLALQPGEAGRVSRTLRDLTLRPVDAQARLEGIEPVVVPAEEGTTVNLDPFLASLQAAALGGRDRLVAAVESVPAPLTTAEAEEAARWAGSIVAAPVSVRFKRDRVGELEPRLLAELVRFEVGKGSIAVRLDRKRLEDVLAPMVKTKTRRPVDADFRIVGTRVRVLRARAGTTLATARAHDAVLAAGLEPVERVATVRLTKLKADFTTREAKALGIREQISTFTTDMGESSANRIWNVHLLGDYMDGTIIRPGQVFSYNDEVGPRTEERGFREGQMIFGGVLIPSIGGGVCQTATTIFNTAFEAGLPIRERHNHSFYISHYPMGRDATVSWGGPDLVFRNDLENAILVKVTYTDSTFTVSFYGTKQKRKVVATTSSPTSYTPPRLQYAVDPSAPPGSVTTTQAGGPGFYVTVHRKVYERGKLIRQDEFPTTYVPQNPTAIYGPGKTPPGPYFILPTT